MSPTNHFVFSPATSRAFIQRLLLFYALLLLGGIVLLSLPISTRVQLNFTDTVFTAISAITLDGHTVTDTTATLTWQGKLFLLLLMQVAGVGAMFFSSLIFYCLQNGPAALQTATRLLKQVVGLTLLIELLGAAGIFFLWNEDIWFDSIIQKAGYSAFHSVSAFCNVGFSLFSKGIAQDPIRYCYLLHLMMAIIIFLGSLGFPAITDMFSRSKLRERLLNPDQPWELSTRLALYTSMLLLLGGAAFFWFAENDVALQGQRVIEKAITALFQSASARTAGLASVDIASLSHTALMGFMLLMLLGASPGSTGGGLHTSVAALLLLRAVSYFRGQKEFSLSGHSITAPLMQGVARLAVFTMVCVFACSILLLWTQPGHDVFSLFFESVSAFSTTGFSIAPAAAFSATGKWILMCTMLAGRVGLLWLAAKLLLNYFEKADN